ncbi:MAG: SDR family NAD(P)-dependent oxidoreductase [Woeseiaceae bacterium]
MNLTIRQLGVTVLLVAVLSSAFSLPAVAADAEGQKAVLVTGASSGIGRKMTEVLAEKGFFVYAGARKQADIDALNAIDNVQAVKLDVTVQKEVDAAVATIESEGRGLYGLINNAGVYIGGPMIDVAVEELEWMTDVNVTGVVRVTQAFASLIIESKGRISTTGSVSGIGTLPFGGQYSMTKHAVEAFTDALAQEMEPLGVAVSIIEPGRYDSAISRSALARMREKANEYAREGSPFAEKFAEIIDTDGDRSMYKPPDEVAEAAVHAMSSPSPLRRYMVVPDEMTAEAIIGVHVDKLVQLNAWQAYSFSREELIAMLDAVPSSDTAQAELTALVHYFLANSSTQEAHAKFWANDLVYTSSNGTRFGKEEIMAGFADETAGENAAASEEDAAPSMSYTGEDVRVQIFGTTAIVTFRLVGTPDDGSATSEYFNSGTFVHRQGSWRAVAWQATIIPGDG